VRVDDPRRVIVVGAVVTIAGLAVAGTAPIAGVGAVGRIEEQQTVGGVLVLLGWGLLVWGIHRFGRASD